jgi:hypothetical protein
MFRVIKGHKAKRRTDLDSRIKAGRLKVRAAMSGDRDRQLRAELEELAYRKAVLNRRIEERLGMSAA